MRRLKNLLIRQNKISKEVKVRNTSRIDKRKYYGIKTNITDYEKLIKDIFYDEDLIKSEILSQESLSDYFNIINERILKARDTIREIILDTMKKGSRRVQTTDGEVLKFEELKDQSAIDIITNQQFDYLKNLGTKQHELIRQELINGQENGLSIDDISNNIMLKVKGVTKQRATTIARTELVKAHNVAQVNTMKELGAKHYIYWTSQDKRVSKICKKLQGYKSKPNVYDIDKAGKEHPLPVLNSHPNCRCTILIKE